MKLAAKAGDNSIKDAFVANFIGKKTRTQRESVDFFTAINWILRCGRACFRKRKILLRNSIENF